MVISSHCKCGVLQVSSAQLSLYSCCTEVKAQASHKAYVELIRFDMPVTVTTLLMTVTHCTYLTLCACRYAPRGRGRGRNYYAPY